MSRRSSWRATIGGVNAPGEATALRTVLCDLDGVVWLSRKPIAGSVEAIEAIRDTGRRVLFVTNNSRATAAEVEEALGAVGIPAEGDVVTSAMAAGSLIEEGEKVLVAGDAGIIEAVERRGAEAIRNDGDAPDHVDAVVVGLHYDFDYHSVAAASRAIRGGARFIATNDDATFPTPHGLEPGCGAIVAAVAVAAGEDPVVAGKPHRPMAAHILSMLGEGIDPHTLLMVGDRPSTDGAFATTIGCDFALVRSGVTAPDADVPSRPPVHLDLADLAALAEWLGNHPDDRTPS